MLPEDRAVLLHLLARCAFLPADHPRVQETFNALMKHFHFERINYPGDYPGPGDRARTTPRVAR